MDINYIFFVLTLLALGMNVVSRGIAADTRTISSLVLLGAGALFLGVPGWGGYAAFGLWLGVVWYPGRAYNRLLAAWMVGDLEEVARRGRIVGRLHPGWLSRERARGYRWLATVALELGDSGQSAVAAVPLSARWEVEQSAIAGDWRRVRAAAEELLAGRGLDPVRCVVYLRALGELGAVDELDRAFVVLHRGLREPARSMARLYLAAFHGEEVLVDALLQGPLQVMPEGEASFWRATAGAVAGNLNASVDAFRALAEGPVSAVARAAKSRLAFPLGPGRPMSYDLRVHVGGVLLDEARYGDGDGSPGPLVRIVIGACCVAFLYAEWSGGRSRSATLYTLGAFLPSAVILEGEWWRFITALFLHAGFAHLTFNMLALYSLAPFVERRLGVLRCLGIYFIAGIGGLAVITALTFFFGFEERLVLGASGGVMGLVGATAAILRRASLIEGSALARERLRSVGAILGVQVVFDLLVPQTSATAHLVGALTGYVVTALVLRLSARSRGVG
jgi:rhomboid protease GluP